MVFNGFWFFDMSDEVRENYPPRPGECMSQLHNNTATLTTLQKDYRLFEWFRRFRLCKFFWFFLIVVVLC